MQGITLRLLQVLALDLPVYRELFAKVGGAIIGLLRRKPAYVYEGRLRGMTYHQTGGKNPRFVGREVTFVGRSRIELGEEVVLYGWNFLHAGDNGFIRISAHTHVDVYSVLYGHGGLTIGCYCAIASGVIIYTQTNQYDAILGKRIVEQPVRYASVTIGDDVWIGARATILPGVRVGEGAVIGAGALVRTSVAPYTIVVGVPAREVGRRPS